MTHQRIRRVLGLAAAGISIGWPLAAQSAGSGFLFHEPVATLTLRGGFSRASAGSDLFSFTTDEFTLGRSDFSGGTVAADVGIRLKPRLQLVLGTAYTGSSKLSEYRHWTDNKNLPIEQTTSLDRVPVTASVKAYLTSPGRTVGRFAWVPSRYAPYVGAGVGAIWYRFRQQGDFINTNTLAVRADDLSSVGWGPSAQGFAGVDFSLTPRLAVSTEAKYVYARAKLDEKVFSGFQPIDLSGLSATVGLHVRL
jgi:hypothetical protein